jgi:hypothetical protein
VVVVGVLGTMDTLLYGMCYDLEMLRDMGYARGVRDLDSAPGVNKR